MRNKIKEPFNGFSHLASALAAACGTVALWSSSPPIQTRRAALLVYSISLVLLFSASATYHLARASSRGESILRRIDHSAIFLLIAGTYTPPCLVILHGAMRTGLLVAIWIIAAAGIALVNVSIERIPRSLIVVVYVVMGWLGVTAAVPLVRALPFQGLAWLLAGGVLYTAGAVVYATKKLDFFPGRFGHHEIWHLFVSGGAAAHYIFILRYIAPFAS